MKSIKNTRWKTSAMSFLLTGLVMGVLSMNLVQKAPQARIGYASSSNILNQLPEWNQVSADLDTLEKELTVQLEEKVKTYQQRSQEYEAGEAGMNEVIRADKQEELKNLEASINKFRESAQQEILSKRKEWVQPILKKVNEAIQQTAELQGYTHILNIDAQNIPIMLYADQNTNVEARALEILNQKTNDN